MTDGGVTETMLAARQSFIGVRKRIEPLMSRTPAPKDMAVYRGIREVIRGIDCVISTIGNRFGLDDPTPNKPSTRKPPTPLSGGQGATSSRAGEGCLLPPAPT